VTRPLIGITSYREQARWGTWDVPAVLLPATYADAVADAGGDPVLLVTAATTPGVVARLDGLVLAGGADVDPGQYGAAAGPHTTGLRPDRDGTERALLEAALAADVPVLAVCRGMQLLNVTLGGDLVQHLPDRPGAGCHDPGPGLFAGHTVRCAPGSRTAQLLGESVDAHCHHHQALDRVADTLTVTAWAQDGTVEAVERTGSAFCLGVQWHPEAGQDRRLFRALVAAASRP